VFFSAGQSAGFGPLDFLSWHGGYPDWDRVCRGPASTVLPDGRIARRDVRHVRCGDYRGDIWELWIDRETGLLLKVVGEVGGGDFGLLPGPATSAKGGFEVEQLRYNPAFPDGTFSVVAPPGSIDYQRRLQAARSRAPSFRAVVDWGTGKQTYQEKVAWLSDRRWRRDVLSAERGDPALPGGAGSFAVWADGRLQRYNARDNTYSRVSSPGSDPRDALLPEADFGYSTAACRVVGRERVAGRRAVHRRCKAEDFWIDSSTGLTLRKRAPEGELRVRSIEFRPTFPPSTFRFSSPTGSRSAQEVQRERDRTKTRLTPGKLAPAWQAPKLGGGAFRVADLRGKPAFLLFLADWCPGTDPACDVLGPFKAAYERFKDEVAFVWVDPQGRTVEARKIARHNGLTLPVVVDSKGASIKAWNIEGVPYWVLLDADGRVIEARYKPQTTAKLDELLTKETGRP
jgi:peroxiredoxin